MVAITCLLQYTVFDQLKQKLIQRQRRKNAEAGGGSSPVALSAFSAFLLGAISKSVATILTYPLIRWTFFFLRRCTSGPFHLILLANATYKLLSPYKLYDIIIKQVQGHDSGCRPWWGWWRWIWKARKIKISQNNVGRFACHVEQGRHPRLLQRITCSDTQDCPEFCIAADDKGEDFKIYLDFTACPAAIFLCFSEENQECITFIIIPS